MSFSVPFVTAHGRPHFTDDDVRISARCIGLTIGLMNKFTVAVDFRHGRYGFLYITNHAGVFLTGAVVTGGTIVLFMDADGHPSTVT